MTTSSSPSLSWESDLLPLPEANAGYENLRLRLERLRTHEDLLHILGQYVQFNAPFGAGVANLAGQIAVRQDLFGEPGEQIGSISDRSYEIAAQVFAAAIEEFCGCPPGHPQNHRRLAQDVLKAAGKFFGYSTEQLGKIVEPTKATASFARQAREGYGIGRQMNEADLQKSLGFHVGSEKLAGEEFRIFDAFLRNEHPDLVRFMECVHPDIADVQTYIWFKLHTTVEDEHADHALSAANLALHYYRGGEDLAEVKHRMVGGFIDFADIQAGFLSHISDEH